MKILSAAEVVSHIKSGTGYFSRVLPGHQMVLIDTLVERHKELKEVEIFLLLQNMAW